MIHLNLFICFWLDFFFIIPNFLILYPENRLKYIMFYLDLEMNYLTPLKIQILLNLDQKNLTDHRMKNMN